MTSRQLAVQARAAGPECVRVLLDIMRNGKRDSERLIAAGMLLDRGFGKPMQAIDVQAVRQDLKRHLEAIVMGSPERLAKLKARLAAIEEFDGSRMIEAIAAPADDGAVS